MKRFVLVLFLFSVVCIHCKTSGDNQLVGKWEIVEFRFTDWEKDPGRDEDFLKEDGAVWDMEFFKNGKFKQSFNMRRPDKKMETEEGTWHTVGDTLKIETRSSGATSKWDYTYELNDGTLTMTLAGEMIDSKLIIKFREK